MAVPCPSLPPDRPKWQAPRARITRHPGRSDVSRRRANAPIRTSWGRTTRTRESLRDDEVLRRPSSDCQRTIAGGPSPALCDLSGPAYSCADRAARTLAPHALGLILGETTARKQGLERKTRGRMDNREPIDVPFLIFVIIVTILVVALGVVLFPHR